MSQPTRLPFTVTSRGEQRELALALHEHTRSTEHVGELVARLLDTVTDYVDAPRAVSDGDVIQALTLAVAVRLNTAGVPMDTARTLLAQLMELSLDTSAGEAPDAGRRH